MLLPTSLFVKSASHSNLPHRAIVLAGLAGALAEVVFVGLFCALTPLSGGEVLRQIAATVVPALAGSALAPVLGLLLHFALGVVVAYAFGFAIWHTFARRSGGRTTMAMALFALAGIWAVNFFAVLPAVNAGFVGLMPYGVTFASKLLFGIAMATTLNASGLVSRSRAPAGTRARVAQPLQLLH